MPGKRLRFVRSSTSFDDMSVLDQPLPPPKLRVQMKPPCFTTNVPMAEDDDVSQTEILALCPSYMKEIDHGHCGNFLDRCNYCRKILGEKDNIYMYSSLRAFCSSQCRDRQIVVDKFRKRVYGQYWTKLRNPNFAEENELQ